MPNSVQSNWPSLQAGLPDICYTHIYTCTGYEGNSVELLIPLPQIFVQMTHTERSAKILQRRSCILSEEEEEEEEGSVFLETPFAM